MSSQSPELRAVRSPRGGDEKVETCSGPAGNSLAWLMKSFNLFQLDFQNMNNRGPLEADQRAGRKRKIARVLQEEKEDKEDELFVNENEGSSFRTTSRLPRQVIPCGNNITRSTRSTTGSVIAVQSGFSPSISAVNREGTRIAARGSKCGGNSGRVPKRRR